MTRFRIILSSRYDFNTSNQIYLSQLFSSVHGKLEAVASESCGIQRFETPSKRRALHSRRRRDRAPGWGNSPPFFASRPRTTMPVLLGDPWKHTIHPATMFKGHSAAARRTGLTPRRSWRSGIGLTSGMNRHACLNRRCYQREGLEPAVRVWPNRFHVTPQPPERAWRRSQIV